MKAISVRNPWAWAILYAGKRIENRPRTWYYRGPVLLHASGGMTEKEYRAFADFYEYEINEGPPYPPPLPAMADLPRGGIVGRAEIVDCVTASDSPWFFGPFGLVLDKVKPLPFVACKGALGLFEVPGDVLAAIEGTGELPSPEGDGF